MPASTHAKIPNAPELSWRLVRAEGRSPAIVAFEEAVVAFFLDSASVLGVPKSVAAIYGVCFASPVPLSFADIEDRLDISKGSISQGLRVLRDVGALRVVEAVQPLPPSTPRRPSPVVRSQSSDRSPSSSSLLPSPSSRSDASRRDYYEPDLKLRKLAAHWIDQRLQSQLKAGRGRLEGMEKVLPTADEESSKVLKERLRTLNAWHDQLRRLMPLVRTFLKL